MSVEHYGPVFWHLVRVPFQHTELIWGIVPLYFGWMLNELTSPKASFTTAIQTGFSFLWASTHWAYQSFGTHAHKIPRGLFSSPLAANVLVTLLVFAVGLTALLSGLRRKYPRYLSFLGHTRFSNYFMISIFPIQSSYLAWTWDRLCAIVLFALPIWLLVHFGMIPLRKSFGKKSSTKAPGGRPSER